MRLDRGSSRIVKVCAVYPHARRATCPGIATSRGVFGHVGRSNASKQNPHKG